MSTNEQTATHTPGPWKLSHTTVEGMHVISDSTGNWDIATIQPKHAPSLGEAYGNLKMIVVAPALLAACEAALEQVSHWEFCQRQQWADLDCKLGKPQPECNCWLGQARAAIAQATK